MKRLFAFAALMQVIVLVIYGCTAVAFVLGLIWLFHHVKF